MKKLTLFLLTALLLASVFTGCSASAYMDDPYAGGYSNVSTTRNGTVKRLEDGRLLVRFLSEASAIAPGQSAVFYDGRRVLGGAFIASQRGIRKIAADNQDKL